MISPISSFSSSSPTTLHPRINSTTSTSSHVFNFNSSCNKVEDEEGEEEIHDLEIQSYNGSSKKKKKKRKRSDDSNNNHNNSRRNLVFQPDDIISSPHIVNYTLTSITTHSGSMEGVFVQFDLNSFDKRRKMREIHFLISLFFTFSLIGSLHFILQLRSNFVQ